MKISNLTSSDLHIDIANKRYILGANADLGITLGKVGMLDIIVTPIKGCYCYLDKTGLNRDNGLLAHWLGRTNWIWYGANDIVLKFASKKSLRLSVSNDSIINISENEIELLGDGQEGQNRKAFLRFFKFDFENCECFESSADLLPTEEMKQKHHFLCYMEHWYNWAWMAIIWLGSFLFPILLLFTFWLIFLILFCLFFGVSSEKKKFDVKLEIAKKAVETQTSV